MEIRNIFFQSNSIFSSLPSMYTTIWKFTLKHEKSIRINVVLHTFYANA